MEKMVFFVISLFAFNESHSQLLRSEIYDFSVGDYYGIRHVSNQSGQSSDVTWKVQLFHILEKQVTTDGDTVSYTAQRQTYFPSIGGSVPSLEVDTFQFSHVNLNAFYAPTDNDLTFGNPLPRYWFDDTTSCYVQFTSLSESEYCPNAIDQEFNYRMEIDNMDSCSSNSVDMFLSDYKVFSHAGGPYGGKHFHEDPGFVKQLIQLDYVNRNGVECGTFPDYFLAVEKENQWSISGFPNPCTDQFAVRGIEAVQSYAVSTSDGKVMQEVTSDGLGNFAVSKLPAGIYFLHVTDHRDRSAIIRFSKK